MKKKDWMIWISVLNKHGMYVGCVVAAREKGGERGGGGGGGEG